MAKFSNYFKVVKPQPTVTSMADSQNMGDQGTYSNSTWYQRLVQGSASRLTRYREYDLMDNDVEIARSLDTIAEEMVGSDPNDDMPIDLVIEQEKEQYINPSVVTALKAALRYWSDIHRWNTRLFRLARITVKYGDCFFIRKTETSMWEYVHPKSVVAAIVDDRDMTNVMGWQIKTEVKTPNSPYNQPTGQNGTYSDALVDTYPASDVVWFSLNDDMSDAAPFGESVLRAVYRAQKQKELLEDAIIIYRIQRAPERRVFYIDVGKVAPNRVKAHLEQFKNEIRQRKIPTNGGGVDQVDAVYNPMSMCLALDTKIPLLDGRVLTLQEMINEHDNGTQNWVYSVNPANGEVAPGIVSWAGVTQENVETIKLTLDNGEEIVCTPEHKFPVQGREGRVEAKDLTINDSLFPYTIRRERIRPDSATSDASYTQIYVPATKGWRFVHRVIANYMDNVGESNTKVFDETLSHLDKNTIHHCDFDAFNNNPENLVFMSGKDHSAYHLSLTSNQEAIFSDEFVDRFHVLAQEDIYILFVDLMEKLNSDSVLMSIYQKDNQNKNTGKYKLKTSKIRQKMFLVFMKHIGFDNWKEYQSAYINSQIDKISDIEEFSKGQTPVVIRLLQHVFALMKKATIHNNAILKYWNDNPSEFVRFIEVYTDVFPKSRLTTPEATILERVAKVGGYSSFKDMVKQAMHFNHRVVKIEKWTNQDVGTLTIDSGHKYHSYHTFALNAGVYGFNSEDFFLASRPDGRGSRIESLPSGCLSLDTMIPLLDGREVPLAQLIDEHNDGRQNWTYSVDVSSGEVIPGMISWAGITNNSAEAITLTLDNGKTVTCTPDHKFPVWGKGYIAAEDLGEDDSIIHFELREHQISTINSSKKYTQVYNHKERDWTFVHRDVRNYFDKFEPVADGVRKEVIHHVDVNRFNNNPSNLQWVGKVEHFHIHQALSKIASGRRIAKQKADPEWKAAVYAKSGATLSARLKKDPVARQKRRVRFDTMRGGVQTVNVSIPFTPDMLTIVRYLFDQGNIEVVDLINALNSTKEFTDLWDVISTQQGNNGDIVDGKTIVTINRICDTFKVHHLDMLLKQFGYKNWKGFKSERLKLITCAVKPEYNKDWTVAQVKLLKMLISLIAEHGVAALRLAAALEADPATKQQFVEVYNSMVTEYRKKMTDGKIRNHHFDNFAKIIGFADFKDLLAKKAIFNHKVVKKVSIGNIQVGTLTIDQNETYHGHHNFAVSAGIFTKNSGLGELSDLEYFQWKVFRGLRIPLSYMREGQDGATINDGKSGVAYIQELRFAMYVKRLQGYISRFLDLEFKRYIKSVGIIADPAIFHISLKEPENFGIYRQQQLDSDLLNTYQSASSITHLSPRFSMKKYLQLTDEEIIQNEGFKREELGLDPNGGPKDLPLIYGPPVDPGMAGMGGGMGGGMVAGMGGLGGLGDMGGDPFATPGVEGTPGMDGSPVPPAPGAPPPQ